MSKKIILSLEQALTLPYATQRFTQLGWRVIRIESPSEDGRGRGGDPNRYIGEDTGLDDLHSYYIAPNIGKEAITLNLKEREGRELLKTIIRRLEVDIFLCNTLPKRYKQLGIDYENLRGANPNLIWCGISAFGPDCPERAGYDPALQAYLGYMFLTGEPERDPMLCGLPIVDLKAGDEAFTQVVLALLDQAECSGGREIHISMAQCAASWLLTALPQLAFVEDESQLFTRSGNEHRSFIPCNCYPTRDGYVYLAIGNDSQWQKLAQIPGFESIATPDRMTNQGRSLDKANIYADIRRGLRAYTTSKFLELALAQGLSVSPVHTIKEVGDLEFVKKHMLKTRLPSSKEVSLFPPPVSTEFLEEQNFLMACAPRLGEHSTALLREIGLNAEEIERLKKNGII